MPWFDGWTTRRAFYGLMAGPYSRPCYGLMAGPLFGQHGVRVATTRRLAPPPPSPSHGAACPRTPSVHGCPPHAHRAPRAPLPAPRRSPHHPASRARRRPSSHQAPPAPALVRPPALPRQGPMVHPSLPGGPGSCTARNCVPDRPWPCRNGPGSVQRNRNGPRPAPRAWAGATGLGRFSPTPRRRVARGAAPWRGAGWRMASLGRGASRWARARARRAGGPRAAPGPLAGKWGHGAEALG
jgi:hypothetical protein